MCARDNSDECLLMKITILCSSSDHPVNHFLQEWIKEHQCKYDIELIRSRLELTEGDFLFLVSCSEIIKRENRVGYTHVLVLHASDLPNGRGWSPHVWGLIDGASHITLSLLEAEDELDSGRIWKKIRIPVAKTALWNEVNDLLFDAEMHLMSWALANADVVKPEKQQDIRAKYYRRRTPDDSKIDPQQSLSDQFNLMRVCDPERYPAWFEIHGQKYKIVLEKLNDE